jgi:hypothetical protein
MSDPIPTKKSNGRAPNYLLLLAGVLGAALAVLFYRSFLPHQILFSNDGPLGGMVAECSRLPGRFFGTWRDITWIGVESPSAAPTLTAIFQTLSYLTSPVLFFKFYAPATLLFVGFSAWVLFRQLEFHPAVCVLGGIAAGLNMHFVSTACWGLGTWNIATGMVFLALAAISSKSIKQTWAKAVLAGLAVGMNLMEGYDVGAIMSNYVGIFILFRAFSEETGLTRKTLIAALTEVLVILFAGMIAAHTIHSLVATQIEGVTGTAQDTETKERRWDFATQWSLPKVETLRLVTPGVFGYLMSPNITSSDKSGAYWGLVGHDPRIDDLKSDDPQLQAKVVAGMADRIPLSEADLQGLKSSDRVAHDAATDDIIRGFGFIRRHSGTGDYAGILVALLAVFALANSCRGANTPFSPAERRAVWFWGMAALISILAAWGRYGFFYSLLYRLPYFSTIRNPVKFLTPFHVSWVLLAGYGSEALYRRYLRNPVKRAASLPGQFKLWWAGAAGFEKKWVAACALVLAASLAGAVVLCLSQERLADYLVRQKFPAPVAVRMAASSAVEAAWFIGFFLVAAGSLAVILSGAWSGLRAKTAWICLGAILILDLGRSDLPWIHYYDYQEKYAQNDIVDFLTKTKPYEQRVIGRLEPRRSASALSMGAFGQMYNFWLQNDFPYHDIQCLDFAEMPRMQEMDDAYLRNFEVRSTNQLFPVARLWELTGTRYLIYDARVATLLNEYTHPVKRSFRVVERYLIAAKKTGQNMEDYGDYTVIRYVPKPGRLPGETDPDLHSATNAIIEFDQALPRAKLYAHWETPPDGPATLATLASTNFDPAQSVLLWSNTPVAQAPGDPGADAGTVEITDYHPKIIKLRAVAKLPAVLLLNDRFVPSWSVSVDGHPAALLRCNYIMRGVFLTPGQHTVEFRFHAPQNTLYVSLGGWAAGLLVAGYLVYCGKSRKAK